MSPLRIRVARAALPGCLLAAAFAAPATAQQFPQLGGNPLTTQANWTEGLECADVENDGDLDLFVANGGGFSTPGTQYQNELFINGGTGSFTNESVTRLGVNLSHAKGVFTGDVNADGLIDAMFANAFNTDPPHLYVNNHMGTPGMFLMDSANRGFTSIYSSASGQFGDVDNDGDLDVILNDNGANYLGGAGGQPHLFRNDGNGFFTEATTGWNPPTKAAQMDVQFYDFDQDWDLDFFGDCRANNAGGNHYLMLNDGLGNFTNVSSTLPGTSGNAYEAEPADLNNDTDLDIFFVSFSGFSEGWAQNNYAPSGPLSWSSGGTVGGTTQDDNEICMLDLDNDGDLDAITGSLGTTEKVARNNFIPSGTLSFTNENGTIASISDSTLDATVADVTGDGAYDIITGQGESGQAQWRNKVYNNTGAADNLPPVVVREEPLSMPFDIGPWVVRAEIRDQVMDDGKNWVTAFASYTVATADAAATEVALTPEGFLPSAVVLQPGTEIVWTNTTGSALRLDSTTAGYDLDVDLLPGEQFSTRFVRAGDYTFGAGSSTMALSVDEGAATVDGFYQGGGMYRFEMTDTAAGAGVQLDYQLTFTDWAGNSTTTTNVSEALGPFCGLLAYGLSEGGTNVMSLVAAGNPAVGAGVNFEYFPVTLNPGFLSFALGQFSLPLVGGTLLIDPFTIIFTYQGTPSGVTVGQQFLIPPDATLAYVDLYFQAFAFDLSLPPDFVTFSNGMRLTICP